MNSQKVIQGPTHPILSPDNIRLVNSFLNEIKPIADEHNATLGQLVTAWTIAHRELQWHWLERETESRLKIILLQWNLILSKEEIALIKINLTS